MGTESSSSEASTIVFGKPKGNGKGKKGKVAQRMRIRKWYPPKAKAKSKAKAKDIRLNQRHGAKAFKVEWKPWHVE